MSISDISNGFGFLGGLGMFLYGMNIMADGMQKTAGSKMSSFLGMLTNNRFLAVAIGRIDHSDHPVQWSHNGHGSRFCKCRRIEPVPGGRRDHGC